MIHQLKENLILFIIVQRTQTKKIERDRVFKVDRNVQRLVTAYESGREINVKQVLQHELIPVPRNSLK